MMELTRFIEPVKRVPMKFAILRLDEIEIPPIQRDISESHVQQLSVVISKLGFLTPIVVVDKDRKYYVIDGLHRIEALKSLGVEEVTAIVVDESYYNSILDFNTEKAPNIKERCKQAYRLYGEFLKINDSLIEEDLDIYLHRPEYVTIGIVLEELNNRFPASFYESFVSKIDNFLPLTLKDALKERVERARVLNDLNEIVNQKYVELGFDNALLKGEIVRRAIQKSFGMRIKAISEDFYTAIEIVKETCKNLTKEDFERVKEV